MSDLPVMGSLDRPVRLDPWQRIVEVNWGGAVGVLTVTSLDFSANSVRSVVPVPDEAPTETFVGSSIARADYRDAFILRILSTGNLGTVLSEDAITGTWVIDATVDGPYPDHDDIFVNAESDLTSAVGRPPELHVNGALIEFTSHSHTHPDGTSTTYLQGYSALTSSEGFDFSGRQESAWYHLHDIEAQHAQIQRKSWLVNFSKVTAAELRQIPITLEFTTGYVLKIYSGNPSFTISDGDLIPVGSVSPRATFSGSAPSSSGDRVVQFNKTGII